ncbi:MAG: NAD(P)H-binding protein [Rhodobacter sp.]|nr:NAD(P)H-binding protein [Rhodobacter sp.]
MAAAKRVLLLGVTGTIGSATAHELTRRGHAVTCFLRPSPRRSPQDLARLYPGAALRFGEITDPGALSRDGIRGQPFDALVSCLASRTGAPQDAWAIDHRAHLAALAAARDAGIPLFVQLSAICVQKPRLAFQQAKLAFEEALKASGLTYCIIRPTAFFKSLSGQVARVRAGKPYVVFGDGRLTACKPISDGDLARYLADCLTDPSRWNRTLPIGGPGPALTPRDQAEALFGLLGRAPRYRHVPVAAMDAIIGALAVAGRVVPRLAATAELARIGRYYATESMLVWDAEAARYDADATPEFGTETLPDFYAQLIRGDATADLGDHAVF